MKFNYCETKQREYDIHCELSYNTTGNSHKIKNETDEHNKIKLNYSALDNTLKLGCSI